MISFQPIPAFIFPLQSLKGTGIFPPVHFCNWFLIRYKKEVIEEAEKLGLDKDEVMKELISEPVLQTGTFGGKAEVAPPSGRFGVKAEESKSNWFGLKAEEELVEETLLVSNKNIIVML